MGRKKKSKQIKPVQHGSGAAWSPEDDWVLAELLGEKESPDVTAKFKGWSLGEEWLQELEESLGEEKRVLPPAQGVPVITPPRPGSCSSASPLGPPALMSPCPGSALKSRPMALKTGKTANLPPPPPSAE
jgi:hypothetical protein